MIEIFWVKDFKLPIKDASTAPDGVDRTALYKETGYFTVSWAYVSSFLHSNISYINREGAILCHTGYEINDLATKNRTFEMVPICY